MHEFVDLELAKAYHGHLGPNLLIGVKLGNYAVRALSVKHFGIKAQVHCPAKPPVSCLIDGVQLASGCTMGKANISHVTCDTEVKATFTNTETGKTITLRVRDGVIEEAMREYQQDKDACCERVWSMTDAQVFEVREG